MTAILVPGFTSDLRTRGPKPWADVRAFGAKGDGATNDVVAINAAITSLGAAGGNVLVPQGHYRVRGVGTYSADSLTVPYAVRIPETVGPIKLVGVPGGTFIELDTWAGSGDNNVVPLLIGGSAGARRTARTTLDGIVIDGRVAAQRTAGATYTDFGVLTAVSTDGLIINNCDIKGWNAYGGHILRSSTGVRLKSSRFIEDVKCGITSTLGALLRIESFDIDVDGCLFITDPFHGHGSISFGDNADIGLQARGMRVHHSGFFGGGRIQQVDLGGVDGCILDHNFFSDSLSSGVFVITLQQYTNANGTVYSARHNVVESNTFHNVMNGVRATGSNGTINSTKWSEGAYLNQIINNRVISSRDFERTSLGTLANSYPVPILPFTNIVFETGTATSGGATTLTNSGAAWTSNEWIDIVLKITGGTGVGQTRRIASNTSTALTVTQAWTVNPDATSVYSIQSYVTATATSGANSTLTDSAADYGTSGWTGGAITIISGTGAGQARLITSHTATVITITGTWGTNPDSTSVYALTLWNTKTLQIAFQDNATVSLSGTTTSGAAGSITLTGTSLTTDQYKNYWIFLTGGLGAGQMRRITTNSNAANSVCTTVPNWLTTPDATTTWTIGVAPIGLNTWANNIVEGGATSKALSTATYNNGSVWDNNQFHGIQTYTTAVQDNAAATPKARIRGSIGYNPLGGLIAQPAVAASTVAVYNTYGVDATVYIAAGTVTAISVGGTATGLITGAVKVPFGSYISITYAVAPTWVWYGD